MKLFCTIFLVIGFTAMAVGQETDASVHAIFKQYDNTLLKKIENHWLETVTKPFKDPLPTGKVVLEFRLFPDGHVSDLKVDSSDVKPSLVEPCKKAVTDSAPFASWTTEIRQAYTNDFRVIHFTFYYGQQNAALKSAAITPSVSTNK